MVRHGEQQTAFVCDTRASGLRGASKCDRGLVNVGGAQTSKVEWVANCATKHTQK